MVALILDLINQQPCLGPATAVLRPTRDGGEGGNLLSQGNYSVLNRLMGAPQEFPALDGRLKENHQQRAIIAVGLEDIDEPSVHHRAIAKIQLANAKETWSPRRRRGVIEFDRQSFLAVEMPIESDATDASGDGNILDRHRQISTCTELSQSCR